MNFFEVSLPILAGKYEEALKAGKSKQLNID